MNSNRTKKNILEEKSMNGEDSLEPKRLVFYIFANHEATKSDLSRLFSHRLQTMGFTDSIKTAERIKKLGFEIATKAGISIGIDDLKMPKSKPLLLKEAIWEDVLQEERFQRGEINFLEQIEQTLNNWTLTGEALKEEALAYLRKGEGINPIYLMAYSGARGNVTQVRQLIGMRGLMANSSGEVINVPIRSNFREGLTLTEFLISCFGARKGLIDTALRTATAGYLTRRLIDVGHGIQITEFDCETSMGIELDHLIDPETKKFYLSEEERLIGRSLAKNYVLLPSHFILGKRNQILSFHEIQTLMGYLSCPEMEVLSSHKLFFSSPLSGINSLRSSTRISRSKNEFHGLESTLSLSLSMEKKFHKGVSKLSVRSPLVCQSRLGICSLCYGWNFEYDQLVEIGEAVGILAAQSIGEPGTQLTLRTFHTGGIVDSEVKKPFYAPYEGFLKYDLDYKTFQYEKGLHGEKILVTRGKTQISINENQFFVPSGTTFYIPPNQFVQEKQVLGEKFLIDIKKTDETVPINVSIGDPSVVLRHIYCDESGSISFVLQNKGSRHFIASKPYFKFYEHFKKQKDKNRMRRLLRIPTFSNSFYKHWIQKSWLLYGEINSKIHPISQISDHYLGTQYWAESPKNFDFQLKRSWFMNLCRQELQCREQRNLSSMNFELNKSSLSIKRLLHRKEKNLYIGYKNSKNNASFQSGLWKSRFWNPKNFSIDHKTRLIFQTNRNKNRIFKENFQMLAKDTISKNLSSSKNFPSFKFRHPKTLVSKTKNSLKTLKGKDELKTFLPSSKSLSVSVSSEINSKKSRPIKANSVSRSARKEGPLKQAMGSNFYNLHLNGIWSKKNLGFASLENSSENPSFSNLFKNKKSLLSLDHSYWFYEPCMINEFDFKRWVHFNQTLKNTPTTKASFSSCDEIEFSTFQNPIHGFQCPPFFEFNSYGRKIDKLQKGIYINSVNRKFYEFHKHPREHSSLSCGRETMSRTSFEQRFFLSWIKHCPGSAILKTNLKKELGKIPLPKTGIPERVKFDLSTDPFLALLLTQLSLNPLKKVLHPISLHSGHVKTKILFRFQSCPSRRPKMVHRQEIFQRRGCSPHSNTMKEGILRSITTKTSNKEFLSLDFPLKSKRYETFLRFETFSRSYLKSDLGSLKRQKNLSNREKFAVIGDFFQKNGRFHFYEKSKFTQNLLRHKKIDSKECISIRQKVNLVQSKLPLFSSGQLSFILPDKLIFHEAKIYAYEKGQLKGGTIKFLEQSILHKGDKLFSVSYRKTKSGDITQGLPKIEELFEARKTRDSQPIPNSPQILLEYAWRKRKKWARNQEFELLKTAQQLVVDRIQLAYQGQGVVIQDRNFEIIVRQMGSRFLIQNPQGSGFLEGEWISRHKARRFPNITIEPQIMGITSSALNAEGFLSSASFQETKRVLERVLMKKTVDELKGLKEALILGKVMPAGTGILIQSLKPGGEASFKPHRESLTKIKIAPDSGNMNILSNSLNINSFSDQHIFEFYLSNIQNQIHRKIQFEDVEDLYKKLFFGPKVEQAYTHSWSLTEKKNNSNILLDEKVLFYLSLQFLNFHNFQGKNVSEILHKFSPNSDMLTAFVSQHDSEIYERENFKNPYEYVFPGSFEKEFLNYMNLWKKQKFSIIVYLFYIAFKSFLRDSTCIWTKKSKKETFLFEFVKICFADHLSLKPHLSSISKDPLIASKSLPKENKPSKFKILNHEKENSIQLKPILFIYGNELELFQKKLQHKIQKYKTYNSIFVTFSKSKKSHSILRKAKIYHLLKRKLSLLTSGKVVFYERYELQKNSSDLKIEENEQAFLFSRLKDIRTSLKGKSLQKRPGNFKQFQNIEPTESNSIFFKKGIQLILKERFESNYTEPELFHTLNFGSQTHCKGTDISPMEIVQDSTYKNFILLFIYESLKHYFRRIRLGKQFLKLRQQNLKFVHVLVQILKMNFLRTILDGEDYGPKALKSQILGSSYHKSMSGIENRQRISKLQSEHQYFFYVFEESKTELRHLYAFNSKLQQFVSALILKTNYLENFSENVQELRSSFYEKYVSLITGYPLGPNFDPETKFPRPMKKSNSFIRNKNFSLKNIKIKKEIYDFFHNSESVSLEKNLYRGQISKKRRSQKIQNRISKSYLTIRTSMLRKKGKKKMSKRILKKFLNENNGYRYFPHRRRHKRRANAGLRLVPSRLPLLRFRIRKPKKLSSLLLNYEKGTYNLVGKKIYKFKNKSPSGLYPIRRKHNYFQSTRRLKTFLPIDDQNPLLGREKGPEGNQKLENKIVPQDLSLINSCSLSSFYEFPQDFYFQRIQKGIQLRENCLRSPSLENYRKLHFYENISMQITKLEWNSKNLDFMALMSIMNRSSISNSDLFSKIFFQLMWKKIQARGRVKLIPHNPNHIDSLICKASSASTTKEKNLRNKKSILKLFFMKRALLRIMENVLQLSSMANMRPDPFYDCCD